MSSKKNSHYRQHKIYFPAVQFIIQTASNLEMLSGIRHVIGTSGGVILSMFESLGSVTIREFLDQLKKDSTLIELVTMLILTTLISNLAVPKQCSCQTQQLALPNG